MSTHFADRLIEAIRQIRGGCGERQIADAKLSPTAVADIYRTTAAELSTPAVAFEDAIALQPSDPEAHLTMGWALIAAGEPEEGLAFVQAATRLDPNYPSHYALFEAAALYALNDLTGAADVIEKELNRNPQATELMPFAASVLALNGDRRAGRAIEQGIRSISTGLPLDIRQPAT